MRRRSLLQPVDCQGQRRELAKARKAAFAEPPVPLQPGVAAGLPLSTRPPPAGPGGWPG
jgi:hypothetical protein